MTDLPAIAKLKSTDTWVAWKYVTKKNRAKPTKVPIDPNTGRFGAVNKSDTWSSHDKAVARAERDHLPGIGYLRGLPPMERLAAMRRNVDEATASAILSAPPHLSGLSDEQWGNFRESRLLLRHPEKLASLDAAQQATKLVSRTLEAARTSTRERYLPLLPAAEVEVKPLAPAWVP
jgi:hypothetical protein